MLTNFKTQQMFITLRAQGESFDRISKDLNVSKPTLIKWDRQYKEAIAEEKETNRMILIKQYKLYKYNQLAVFGRLLIKIRKELSNRDFTDVPSDKLVDMLERIYIKANDVIVDMKFEEEGESDDREVFKEMLAELDKVKQK